MFIDLVKIKVQAGDGGHGCMSFRREKFIAFGGPDGGDGGRGGDVIARASKDLTTLMDIRHNAFYKAKNGKHGKGARKTGAKGEDLYITVPLGTQIYDAGDDLIADLVDHTQQEVIAHGGRGGRGNVHFASSTNRAPRRYEKGEMTQAVHLKLELKLIANFALIGFPNAGKSTLLSVLSDACPKITSYPFTTLTPNLGVLDLDDQDRIILADIPGLIQGAHEGAGLGFQFLRHIERCQGLIFVFDVSGQEGRDPFWDYHVLYDELMHYNEEILERPQIFVANKMDVPGSQETFRVFQKKMGSKTLIPISAKNAAGLDDMIAAMRIR